MGTSYDRREFLRKGAASLGAAAAAGLSGSLLEACSSTPSSKGGSKTTTTLSASGVTDHKRPRQGGSLTIGTWSEVNGLSPPTARWDATGYLYGNALFDTLVQIGADGKAHPYLARSFSPNADYTVWTFELRPGIKFHNGEDCNAGAVANSLNASRTGLVTAQSLKPVEKIVAVGESTVRITLNQPWPAFPSYLAGQIGYICAPAMLASANQGALNPIGTGPFLFESWEPNVHLTAKKNPSYWQPKYPYLDSITFKPVADNTAREDALLAGSINLMHCQAPRSIRPFFGNSKYQVILGELPPRAEPDVDFILLNLQAPPLNDRQLRQALAMAVDTTALRETYGDNLTTLVSGPFVPGEIWYTHTNYPTYNPAEAKRIVESYQKRTGDSAPAIKLTTITGPQYAQVAQIVQQGWEAAGVKTTVAQEDFTSFVTNSVLGNFQACTYEQFGATDPDQNYIWWSTDTVAKVGAVSLNMARNSDLRIQKALDKGRQSTDLAVRARAYQDVSKYLAEDLPYLWMGRTYWAAVCQSDVVGVTNQVMPDGTKSIGFNNGAFLVHELAFTS
jgi:peptide/nickel transport system substrate-binding protein